MRKIPPVSQMWLESRFTDAVLGAAIHYIATAERSADAIWDAPTEEELVKIKAVAGEWLKAGCYEVKPVYKWWRHRFMLAEIVTL